MIPYGRQSLDASDAEAVLATLHSDWLTQGPAIPAFEAEMAAYCQARHAVAVCNATAALHLACLALDVGPGDRVLTTPFSFVASTNVVLFEQAVPIFVDVDARTGNISPELAGMAALDLVMGGSAARQWLPRRGVVEGGHLKALLAVDVFGQPADYDQLSEITRRHDLALIEDSCEALGAQYKGRKAGMLGDMGVFAFYPNKQITTGEGGLVVTNDETAAKMMRALRNQGRAPGDTWLSHTHLGYNYRMDELSAALGRVQMMRLEELLQKREQVANWYMERLPEIPWLEPPQLDASTSRVSWFVFVIRVERGMDRDEVARKLEARGIPVRPYFQPIHLQPYMVERFGYQPGDFPVTEDLGARGLALPFSGQMTEAQVELVCRVLQEI